MQRETKKQVAVRFEPSLHKRCLKAAKKEKISFGQLVRNAVTDYLGGAVPFGK
jgi:predicted HicB family RNase H-like nuclease